MKTVSANCAWASDKPPEAEAVTEETGDGKSAGGRPWTAWQAEAILVLVLILFLMIIFLYCLISSCFGCLTCVEDLARSEDLACLLTLAVNLHCPFALPPCNLGAEGSKKAAS